MTSEGDAVGRAAATTFATDKGSLLSAFTAEAYERDGGGLQMRLQDRQNLQLRQARWEMCSPVEGEV